MLQNPSISMTWAAAADASRIADEAAIATLQAHETADDADVATLQGQMTAAQAAITAAQNAITALGVHVEFNFVYNLAITLALGGVADRDITTGTIASGSLTGLLATDKIVEMQVAGDLPSGFGVVQQRITGAGALRVRFISPIAVVLSSTAVTFKLTVKRG